MKFKSEIQEIHTITVKDLVLHVEALATPRMSVESYEALKADILLNGQIDPVLVFRGKIIDGRHRWLILQELGIDSIKYIALPNNTTLAQLRSIVQSKETRRHESPAQLAIRAYRLKVAPNSEYKSFASAADAVGATKSRVSEANSIVAIYGRLDILDMLFNGDKFNTGTETAPFHTDSLATILKWLATYGKAITPVRKIAGIEPRKELSTDEQLTLTSYINAITKESELVRIALANHLYSITKDCESPATF